MRIATISHKIAIFCALITGIALILISPTHNAQATVEDEIELRNKQIQELQQQIEVYQKQLLETSGKSKSLSSEVSRLNAQIGKLQLEIKSLGIAISQTDGEINNTQKSIFQAQSEVEVHKKALTSALQAAYHNDRQSLTEVLVQNRRISDFFNKVKTLDDVQETLRVNIVALKDLKDQLEKKQENLEQKKSDLEELVSLQESQKRSLDQNKNIKDKLLKQTKGDEAKYQSLVKETQQQIERIREQVSYLQQSGLSVEDIISYGKTAANQVGIRPAFVIGILEVESRLGKNVGTGNWKDDMYDCYVRLSQRYPSKRDYYLKRAQTEKDAFFTVINGLGIDPMSVKVSREPSYGCGGAMGPAQFIPSTWLGYQDAIRQYTGHQNPNPWNFQDAFTAAAIKLAKDGAISKTRAGEIRAAKSYLSGNGNCTTSICNYYANLALDKAAIIEQNL